MVTLIGSAILQHNPTSKQVSLSRIKTVAFVILLRRHTAASTIHVCIKQAYCVPSNKCSHPETLSLSLTSSIRTQFLIRDDHSSPSSLNGVMTIKDALMT